VTSLPSNSQGPPGTDRDSASDSDATGDIEADRRNFEYERLRLERQKLAIETRLKRREFLKSQKSTLFKDLFANPFSLAIVGGFITIMTSIVTNSYSARENREADDRRAKQALETTTANRESDDRRARQALEAELVKKFVEAPTKENVRANLTFLVDAALLPNYGEGIRAYLKNHPGAAPTLGVIAGAPREAFDKHVLLAVRSLIADFGLTDFQAAGIVGNFGYETTGFRLLEEISFSGGIGGIGYAMWTGPRRRAFEAFVQSNGLDVASAIANYRFLKQELETTERAVIVAVKKATSLEEATRAFQDTYERSSDPNYSMRIRWAQLALKVFQDSAKADTP
jgi:hypothetical protein